MKIFPVLQLLFISFLVSSCERDEKLPDDAASKAVGTYRVTTYAINGDTLFTSGGVNKNALEEFWVYVQRKTSDSISVGVRARSLVGSTNLIVWRTMAIETKPNSSLSLLPSKEADPLYEAHIGDGYFYEWAGDGQSGIFALGANLNKENMDRLAALKPGRMEILIVAKREE